MDISQLVAGLPGKRGSLYLLHKGKPVRHSYARLYPDVIAAQAELQSWGVTAAMRVGIYAPNSYRWLVYDLALIELGVISVPFTDDFAATMDDTLLERQGVSLLLVAQCHAKLFLDKPSHVAFIDAANDGIRVLERKVKCGSDEEDQLTRVFSPGSAGGLKGLVISRAGVSATLPPLMEAIGVTNRDRFLLFLPLSNFQQRYLCYGAFWYDFDVILTDPYQMQLAMTQLNPTIFLAPPIFYQMLYSEFCRLPAWKRVLRQLTGTVLGWLPSPPARLHLARRLLKGVHEQFGNSIRTVICGMAPLNRSVFEYFARMQLPITETYGMMESGVMTYRPGEVAIYDSVGRTLRDVSFSFREDGEAIVHRENFVTLRYFQCADGENEKTFVGPHQIATGDIGVLGKGGYFFLRGRKKELLITSNGYKLHPETVESELNSNADIASSVVFLAQDASQLNCVIVPKVPGDAEAEKRIRTFARTAKSAKRAVSFVNVTFADAFSRENGMLRPNMKIDRKQIIASYAGRFQAGKS